MIKKGLKEKNTRGGKLCKFNQIFKGMKGGKQRQREGEMKRGTREDMSTEFISKRTSVEQRIMQHRNRE